MPCLTKYHVISHIISCNFSHNILPILTQYPAISHRVSCQCSHNVLPFFKQYPAISHTISCNFSHNILPILTQYPAISHRVSCQFSHNVLPFFTQYPAISLHPSTPHALGQWPWTCSLLTHPATSAHTLLLMRIHSCTLTFTFYTSMSCTVPTTTVNPLRELSDL
jgi:hypothetical protein